MNEQTPTMYTPDGKHSPAAQIMRLWARRLEMLADEVEQGEVIADPAREHAGAVFRTEGGNWHVDLDFEFIRSPARVAEIALVRAKRSAR